MSRAKPVATDHVRLAIATTRLTVTHFHEPHHSHGLMSEHQLTIQRHIHTIQRLFNENCICPIAQYCGSTQGHRSNRFLAFWPETGLEDAFFFVEAMCGKCLEWNAPHWCTSFDSTKTFLTVLNTSRFLLHCWDKVCLSRIAFFSGLCIANKFALDHIAGSKGECCTTPDASCSCWLGSRGWQRLEGHHAQNE